MRNLNESAMKPATTRFFDAVVEPCLNCLGPLSAFLGVVAFTLVFFGLGLVYKTLLDPFGWWNRLSTPTRRSNNRKAPETPEEISGG